MDQRKDRVKRMARAATRLLSDAALEAESLADQALADDLAVVVLDLCKILEAAETRKPYKGQLSLIP
jgi:hypothetical protein